MAQPDDRLRVASLLERAVALLRAHPLPLLLPLLVLGVLSSGGGGGDPWGPRVRLDLDGGDWPGGWLLALPLLAFAGLVALAVLVLLFFLHTIAWMMTARAALAVERGEPPPDFAQAFQDVRPRILPAAGTFALFLLLAFVGLLLLVVPGLFVMAALFPLVPVVLVEGRAGTDALSRAWALTEGHRLDLFLLVLLAFVVSVVGGAAVAWVPLVGPPVAGALAGAVYAFSAVAGAVFYRRRVEEPAEAPAAAPPA